MYLFRINNSSAPSLWFKRKKKREKKLASIMFSFDFVLFFFYFSDDVCLYDYQSVSVRVSVINTVYLVPTTEKWKMSLFDFFSSSTL